MTTDNPHAPPSSAAAQRWQASRLWPLAIAAAFALGLLAFLQAQLLPVYLSEHGRRSVGLGLLLAGAIPWFLQWCSLAILFGVATDKYIEDNVETSSVIAVGVRTRSASNQAATIMRAFDKD